MSCTWVTFNHTQTSETKNQASGVRMFTNQTKKILSRTTMLAGFAGAFLSPLALAQEEAETVEVVSEEAASDDTTTLDKVIVTGSLIQSENLISTSPITTVGALDLSLSNTVNAEQFLNTLPQVIPGFDSTSNNPGIGESTVDLRGLGANRTLVLVNGRRYITSSQNPGVVDLNTIPAALVEQVDILTGGASATYGSDAMAGVVNFTLKNDFEGMQLDTSFEQSETGDGEIFNTSLIMGGNFDNDRGNAVLSMEYTSRGSVLQGDRVQSEFTLVDNGTGFSESGSVNIPSTFVLDFGPNFTDALGIQAPCDVEGTETFRRRFLYNRQFRLDLQPERSGCSPVHQLRSQHKPLQLRPSQLSPDPARALLAVWVNNLRHQ